MIKKLLDKYFLNKLEVQLSRFFMKYALDVKFVKKTKHYMRVYIKDIKYSEKEFEEIGVFSIENSFEYLFDFDSVQKNMEKVVKTYREKNK